MNFKELLKQALSDGKGIKSETDEYLAKSDILDEIKQIVSDGLADKLRNIDTEEMQEVTVSAPTTDELIEGLDTAGELLDEEAILGEDEDIDEEAIEDILGDDVEVIEMDDEDMLDGLIDEECPLDGEIVDVEVMEEDDLMDDDLSDIMEESDMIEKLKKLADRKNRS